MVSDAKWEKGAVTVLKTGIWFVSQNHQICIPIADVSAIEQTKREVQGTDKEVVKIDHVESGDVSTSFVLCPATTLQVLYNYLTDATKDSSLDGELDPPFRVRWPCWSTAEWTLILLKECLRNPSEI